MDETVPAQYTGVSAEAELGGTGSGLTVTLAMDVAGVAHAPLGWAVSVRETEPAAMSPGPGA
jgi:hypothetical protein